MRETARPDLDDLLNVVIEHVVGRRDIGVDKPLVRAAEVNANDLS